MRTIRPADDKPFAATRDFGIEIRARVGDALRAGERVTVDLGDLEDMTPSFADECFGKLSEQVNRDIRDIIELKHGAQFKPLIDAVIRMRLSRQKGTKPQPR